MSLGNKITDKLNRIETFTENAPAYLLPLKILGWAVLLSALLVTNLIALVVWPFALIRRKRHSQEAGSGEPINVSSEAVLRRVLAEHGTVLVDFWAQWCGPCLLMNKTVNEIASEREGQVTVVKVDASLSSALTRAYAVRGLPTFLVFRDGEEVARKAGSLTKRQLCDLLE